MTPTTSRRSLLLCRFFYLVAVLFFEPRWDCVGAKNENGGAWWSFPGRSFADVVRGSSSSSATEPSTTSVSSPSSSKKPTTIQKKPGISPPFYKKLPKGAQAYTVRNVYDGDTFTLLDNKKRVRLLGIDTPEIKDPQQAFAQEAKAFTKKYCNPPNQVYLVFADASSRRLTVDHYGRWLAHVYVQEDDSGLYLCVNEGLVAAGLACTYSPSSSSSSNGANAFHAAAAINKPSNWATLVALQKQARQSQLGIWKDFDDIIVYKTKNGSAYHLPSCQHLATARHLTPMRASQAADVGLHPCRSCLD